MLFSAYDKRLQKMKVRSELLSLQLDWPHSKILQPAKGREESYCTGSYPYASMKALSTTLTTVNAKIGKRTTRHLVNTGYTTSYSSTG